MQSDDINSVTERINAGAAVPAVEPSQIEYMWQAISKIPREQRRATGIDLQHVAAGSGRLMPRPEQRVGMMIRYVLFDHLLEQGLLDEYMKDDVSQKKVLTAVALFPCDKNDLAEATAQRLSREGSREVANKIARELKQAGYDPDHPRLGSRFIDWMRQNCK